MRFESDDIKECFMKIIYNTIFILLCIITLGFFDLRFHYSDGTQIKWTGWITKISNLWED